MFACFHIFAFSLFLPVRSSFLAPLPLIFIHTTCVLLCLRRTSAPIHLTSVLGVLGTQETSCFSIAGLLVGRVFRVYLRLLLPLIFIHTTCVLLCLRRTSAPIHLTSVLGVLGTQETSCFSIAGLLERDIIDVYLLEFDKP